MNTVLVVRERWSVRQQYALAYRIVRLWRRGVLVRDVLAALKESGVSHSIWFDVYVYYVLGWR